MRHRGDPKWAEILERWRYGEYIPEDLDYVNNQCYDRDWKSNTVDMEAFCPIVVTSNTLRCEFNDQSAESFCYQQSKTLHQFPTTRSRSRFRISRSERLSLMHIRDDKTGNMIILLNLAIGMPVQCTQNVSRALELASGTIGHVVALHADQHDTARTTTRTIKINDQSCDLSVCLHTKPPAIVFIQLLEYVKSRSIVDGLPPGIVPIQTHEKDRISISLPDRSFSIRMLQAPVVPAFSLTSEKCQGLTVEKLIIGPLRHYTRNQPQRSSFYVAVTRVRTLAQLYLTEPLTMDNMRYFVPSKAVLEETQRLRDLE